MLFCLLPAKAGKGRFAVVLSEAKDLTVVPTMNAGGGESPILPVFGRTTVRSFASLRTTKSLRTGPYANLITRLAPLAHRGGFVVEITFMVSLSNHEGVARLVPWGASWFDKLTMKQFLALAPFSGASRVIRYADALPSGGRQGRLTSSVR
jgi:hypothetical protein